MTEIMIALGPPTNAVVICEADCGDYYVEDVLKKDGYDAKRVAPNVVIVRPGPPRKFSDK